MVSEYWPGYHGRQKVALLQRSNFKPFPVKNCWYNYPIFQPTISTGKLNMHIHIRGPHITAGNNWRIAITTRVAAAETIINWFIFVPFWFVTVCKSSRRVLLCGLSNSIFVPKRETCIIRLSQHKTMFQSSTASCRVLSIATCFQIYRKKSVVL